MKKHVVMTAGLLAGLSMISGTAFAQTGSVGVSAVRVDTDFGDADAYGVDGDVTFGAGNGWQTTLAASFTDSDDTDGATSGQVHFDNYSGGSAWGLFAGLSDDGDSTTWDAGAEYAMFMADSTFAVNVNYANNDDADVDAYGVSAAYRWFMTPNFRLDIGGTLGRAESSGIDIDVNTIGAGLEWRMDNSPFSVAAAYTRVDGDLVEADVFGLSLRWNFGDESLKAADRNGKTFTSLGTALPSL
jgi:hypothetical protein